MRGKNSYYRGKNSYYIDTWEIVSSHFGNEPVLSEFETYEEAKAFVAFSKLLKLRKDWIEDWQPNWNNGNTKYIICYWQDRPIKHTSFYLSSALSFPTEEMRDDFF